MANSLEDLKAEIQDALQYLNSCSNFAEVEVYNALNVLDKVALRCTEPPTLGIFMLESKFGELCVKMWKDLSKYIGKIDDMESQGFDNANEMMAVVINMTDESPELCVEMGKTGYTSLVLESIKSVEHCLQQDINLLFVDRMLGMLHNCIRLTTENRFIFRQANAVPVLKNTLESNDILIQVDCLMILAYIVDEKERELLATSEKGLKLLLDLLKQCVDTEDHWVHCGDSDFSAYELLDVINLLAINDVNKVEIEKNGAIPSIIRMLEDDFDVKEQRIAAESLWNLCFVETIRQSETLQDAVPLLEKLLTSQNKDLRGACASALWQLRDGSIAVEPAPSENKLLDSPTPKYEESVTVPADIKTPSAKIMISYQWGSQERAIEIRNGLVANGFEVWMDINNMKGDILEAMADAVQKSEVILICMTEKYKDSRCCRSEASYAYKLRKKVIPLLLEKGYKPDGWLGIMQGMDLYYEFHQECKLEDSMCNLLEAVRQLTSCRVIDESDCKSSTCSEPIVANHAETEHSPLLPSPPQSTQPASRGISSQAKNKSRPRVIKEWATVDVQDWLREIGLANLCQTFDFCDGRHLQKLHTKLQESLESDEKFRADFSMDARACLHLTVELETLFEKQVPVEKHRQKQRCRIL